MTIEDYLIKHNLGPFNQKNFKEKVLFFFENDFEYMCLNQDGTNLFKNNEKFISKTNIMQIINYICYYHLFSYIGYKAAILKTFNKKQLVPIYLSEKLILIPTERIRNYENIWFNYKEVKSISKVDNKTKIEFFSGNQINIKTSLNSIKKSIKLIEHIKKHKLEIYGI